MTKKHFIAAAKQVSTIPNDDTKQLTNREVKQLLAKEFAFLFSQNNPNFDNTRFFQACGVDYNV